MHRSTSMGEGIAKVARDSAKQAIGRPPTGAPERVAPQLSPYELLKRAILSGELAPTQALVETSLAAWCGVSRTPVREALRRLEQDGLVERNEHGLSVRKRSPEEILDLYDSRIVLEATAAKVAAERRNDHDVRSLWWILDRCRAVADSDPAGMVDLNRQFHKTVWRASHNDSLIDLLERLDLHLARYPETTLWSPGRPKISRDDHIALTEAIERRDSTTAHDIAEAHFTAARDIRLALFSKEYPTS